MNLPLTAPEGQLSITSIIRDNPNKKTIAQIAKYAKKMTMHITGFGLEEALSKIDYFERPELLKLRQLYSPSNEDFFGRLHRPIDKVFNARGGSCNYYISDSDKPRLMTYLTDVYEGYAIRRWMETFWIGAYHYDPMGMIYMEVGDNTTYPTYKSSLDIYDYMWAGRKLEYVVFSSDPRITAQKAKAKNDNIYYRVVDDSNDYLVQWDGNTATIIPDMSYPNYYGEVPAIIMSDIFDPIRGWYVSPDDNIIGIADQHLRDRSVLTMFKLHHGFPIKWQYQGKCIQCKGTGKINAQDCSSCNGTGKQSKYDVSETISLPVPQTKDDPILAPDVAGYVTPPVETWDKMDETIDGLFEDAHYTKWGTHQLEDSENETATGRFIDVQPVNERLGKYSDAAEFVETWITDMLGRFYFDASYKGCEINYGRRFLIETPDVIWQKVVDAIKDGAPSQNITNLYMQYLQSEFAGDGMEYNKQVKLMRLDPYFYMTIVQVKTLGLPTKDYMKKLYFQQWVNQLGDNDLINKDLKTLQQDLDAYVMELMPDMEAQYERDMQVKTQLS